MERIENEHVEWEIHYQLKGDTKEGVYYKKYKRKGYAKRIAKQLFSRTIKYQWWLVGRRVKTTTDIDQNFYEGCKEVL